MRGVNPQSQSQFCINTCYNYGLVQESVYGQDFDNAVDDCLKRCDSLAWPAPKPTAPVVVHRPMRLGAAPRSAATEARRQQLVSRLSARQENPRGRGGSRAPSGAVGFRGGQPGVVGGRGGVHVIDGGGHGGGGHHGGHHGGRHRGRGWYPWWGSYGYWGMPYYACPPGWTGPACSWPTYYGYGYPFGGYRGYGWY